MTRRRVQSAIFEQVLIYSGGPQLILLSTGGLSLIVAVAVVSEGKVDPYYGAEISQAQFKEFLNERFDVRYLFERPDYKTWYLLDLNDIAQDDSVLLRRMKLTDDLRRTFLPGAGVFARELTEEVSVSLGAAQSVERILVDGSWDLPDFSEFYAQYADLYMFHNSVDTFLDQQTALDDKRRILDAFVKPWQGGGSYGGFYGSLRRVQAPDDRLRVGGITYNSPGHVDVRGKDTIFRSVRDLVTHFSKNNESIAGEYRRIYQALSKLGLLTLAADKFDPKSALAGDVENWGRDLAKALGIDNFGSVLEMSNNDPLIAMKVLLSIERRLKKLYEFFLQGRANFE